MMIHASDLSSISFTLAPTLIHQHSMTKILSLRSVLPDKMPDKMEVELYCFFIKRYHAFDISNYKRNGF